MSRLAFRIEIIEQSWLEGCLPEEDLCSHGKIQLSIGGQAVVHGEEEYGISESALALLRTLEANHSAAAPRAERLIFHGCGTLLMSGCPIGVDWYVTHVNDHVQLSHIVRFDTTSATDAIHFEGLSVEIPFEQYRQQVVAFAEIAKSLFSGVSKTFYDDADQQLYSIFWSEYENLLQRYGHIHP